MFVNYPRVVSEVLENIIINIVCPRLQNVTDRIICDGWDGAVGPLASGLSVVLVCLGVDGSEWFEWFTE